MRIYKMLAVTGLAVVLSAAGILPAAASDEEIENAEYEVKTMEEDLEEVRGTIDTLEEQKEALTGEIDDLQGKLVRTISGIETLTHEVDDLTMQMEQTTADLVVAEEDRDVQYGAMKKRIQYLYETGGDAGWATVFLGAGNLSDVLNKAEYTQQMYNYDRNQLDEYLATVALVEALQTQQYEDRSALETRKHEQEDAQAWLEELLEQAKDEYDDYDAKIAEAYAMADEYQALIEAQNEAIAQLIAAQEAMGVSGEEAAYVAQQIVDSYYAENGGYVNNGGYVDNGGYVNNGGDAGYNGVQTAVGGDGTDTGYTNTNTGTSVGNYTNGNAISQSANTSSRGQAILAYAQQFIGNPYVYGGNSLTDGVDCSGFVQQVMANFGITTQRTSWGQETDGQAVSYNDVQVGDLIIYDGHVGIYAGDNQMINAIDEAHGIGYSDVKSGQITSIRRLVEEDAPAETYTETYTEDYVDSANTETYSDVSYTDTTASSGTEEMTA